MDTYLALDISSRLGYAFLNIEDKKLQNIDYDKIDFKGLTPYTRDYDKGPVKNHPEDYHLFVNTFLKHIIKLVEENQIKAVIIEQTNKGRNRWTQKLLEWQHYVICDYLIQKKIEILYMNTISWRSTLNIRLSIEQKRSNRTLSKTNRIARSQGKKSSGGKVTVKHLAVNWVNQKFGTNLILKDNDIADAICLGYAYLIKNKLLLERSD